MSSRTLALVAVVFVAAGWALLVASKRKKQPLYSISIALFSVATLMLALRSGQIYFSSGASGAGSETIGYGCLTLAGLVTAVALFLRSKNRQEPRP
jgi:hypothetical protein